MASQALDVVSFNHTDVGTTLEEKVIAAAICIHKPSSVNMQIADKHCQSVIDSIVGA